MTRRVIILTDEQIDRILDWAATCEIEAAPWEDEDAELFDYLAEHRLR